MNWNVLRYVIAIAEEQSFSKAARRLYLAQPSLSQSIGALERELGTPLFDRSAGPVRTTYAGDLFVAWAQDALRGQEQTVRRIADVAQGTQTRLIVGASPSQSAYLLPLVMARFFELRPNCAVKVSERTTSELWSGFVRGEFDLMLDSPRAEFPENAGVFLGVERQMLAVPEAMPCPVREEGGEFPVVRLADFALHPFITPWEEQVGRQLCLSLCEQSGFRPRVILECRNLQTIYEMVEAGVGVSILPEFFVRHAARGGRARYCLFDSSPPPREIAVTYRRDRYLTEDARTFIGLLQEMFQ